MEKLIAEISVTVNATPAAVWKVITTPELISKYLYGTTVVTDWKPGNSIEYKGSYAGKEYHDKGTILKIEPEKVFESTYWSSMSGKEDKPENYNKVTYELTEKGSNTEVKLTQDNISSEKEREHTTQNWYMVLDELKKVAEGL